MKLTIIDKNNLPKFKLLLTFEEHNNKEVMWTVNSGGQ